MNGLLRLLFLTAVFSTDAYAGAVLTICNGRATLSGDISGATYSKLIRQNARLPGLWAMDQNRKPYSANQLSGVLVCGLKCDQNYMEALLSNGLAAAGGLNLPNNYDDLTNLVQPNTIVYRETTVKGETSGGVVTKPFEGGMITVRNVVIRGCDVPACTFAIKDMMLDHGLHSSAVIPGLVLNAKIPVNCAAVSSFKVKIWGGESYNGDPLLGNGVYSRLELDGNHMPLGVSKQFTASEIGTMHIPFSSTLRTTGSAPINPGEIQWTGAISLTMD